MELEVRELWKRFGTKTAVEDACFTLTPGVWGLIGANGAGKTTLMRMLTGILRPTSGQILYDGVGILSLGEAYRDALGYLPQTFGFYPEFTVMDYLEYIAALKGLGKREYREKISGLLELLTLTDVRKKQIKKLSGGMQRRVGIAQALLNDPDILILDEPTSGLDPGERIRFRNLLSEFAQNRIVLISTHIVTDVEYIAAQNIIMKGGKIIDIGTTEKLLTAVAGKVFTANIRRSELAYYESAARIVSMKSETNGTITVRCISETPDIPNSVSAEPRLEDLYLWLFRQETAGKEEG
jgi:ABC-2 type transport system ATP-binding protein